MNVVVAVVVFNVFGIVSLVDSSKNLGVIVGKFGAKYKITFILVRRQDRKKRRKSETNCEMLQDIDTPNIANE